MPISFQKSQITFSGSQFGPFNAISDWPRFGRILGSGEQRHDRTHQYSTSRTMASESTPCGGTFGQQGV